MKRLIVSVVALVAVFALSSASVYAVEGMSAGVKAGLNIAKAWGDDVETYTLGIETKMKIGAAFGAFANYVINDYLAVQPELLYTMKGVKSEKVDELDVDGDTVHNAEGKISLNYLEIPILAKVTMPMEGKVKPALLIGPALAFKLTSKYKLEADEGSLEGDVEDVSSIDFGLVFGAGVDVADVGPGSLTADARYTLGLIDVPDEGDASIKNWAISIMLGYSFPL